MSVVLLCVVVYLMSFLFAFNKVKKHKLSILREVKNRNIIFKNSIWDTNNKKEKRQALSIFFVMTSFLMAFFIPFVFPIYIKNKIWG